jgi:hypothetical protein
MANDKMDSAHKLATQELAQVLDRNFNTIDSNKDGKLSLAELTEAAKGPKLSVEDRRTVGFAAEHIREISLMYNGMNSQSKEAKLPAMEIAAKDQVIERRDLDVMRRAAGDTTAPDAFGKDRRLYTFGNAAVEFTYGGYLGSAFGPLGAVAGAGIGGGASYGVFRGLHWLRYGSSDTYYNQKAEQLQRIDISSFPKR